MLTFLNSVVLPALIAAAVPLIIHLLYRRRAKRVPFSSLRFLKLIENKRIRHVRLFQILLIIIRTLLIIFIIMAFARPTLKTIFPGSAGTARTTAVILADDSYSMQAFYGALTAGERLKNALAKISNTFDEEDQIFILNASEYTDTARTARVLSASDRASEPLYKVSNGSPDFYPMFQKAAELLNQYPNYNRELYFLSDFLISPQAVNDSLTPLFKNLNFRTYFLNTTQGEPFDNLSIDTVKITDRILETNLPVHLDVRISNHGLNEARETTISLFAENQRLAMQQVSLKPGESKTFSMTFIPKRSGYIPLQFELDDDALTIDNVYYMNLFIPNEMRFLVVDDQPNRFLRTAFTILNRKSFFQIETVKNDQLYGKNFSNYDAIMINGLKPLQNATIDRLSRFVRTGRSLIIFPGDELNAQSADKMLRPLTGETIYLDRIGRKNSERYYALEAIGGRHPVFGNLFVTTQSRITPPRLFKYWKISNNLEPLLLLQNNDRFLAQRVPAPRSGKIIVAASALDTRWNDLPLKGFFVPMLYRLLYYSAQQQKWGEIIPVNQSHQFTTSHLSLEENYVLRAPDGAAVPVIPKQTDNGLRFRFDRISDVGHYVLFQNERPIHAFSVNHNANELERPFIDFENIFPNAQVLSDKQNIEEHITEARTGTELWRLFLFLALLMLIAEMLIVKRIEGRTQKE